MRNRFALLFTALIIALGALSVTAPASQAVADKDCGDFNTQAQAQNFFLDHGGPQSDPHQLDADGDGIACESNPCPCSTSQGGGGGGNGNGGGGGHQDPVKRQKARVIRVVDGDTVNVKIIKGRKETVRLLGIETPEVLGGEECWGAEASKATKKWLPRGTRVRLISDPSQDLQDRYGRILRYVIKGNADINRLLVSKGHARVYVYNHHPFKRTGKYKTSQRRAKSHHLGLWGGC